MADQCTHLARGEVEYRPVVGIKNERAPGPLDDRGVEASAIADQMPARGRPEGGILIVRHVSLHQMPPDNR